MSLEAYATLTILALTFLALIKTRVPPAAVFLGALTAAMTLGLAPIPRLLSGFSNQGMLTVAVLFVVAAGMYSTGAVSRIIEPLVGSPKTTLAAQARILPSLAAGSAFLNNTPLVAMLIPVIQDMARQGALSVRQLFIPLSFASIMGGACTVIGTSTNLIVAGLVADALSGGKTVPGLRQIAMFDPAWPGVPVALTGMIFLMALTRFLLPARKGQTDASPFTRCYSGEFRVKSSGGLSGKPLSETGFTGTPGLTLLSLAREDENVLQEKDPVLKAGDSIAVTADRQALIDLWREDNLIPLHGVTPTENRHDHLLVSAVVSGISSVAGRRVRSLPTSESPYHFRVVALSRDGDCVDTPLARTRIQAGDHVLLEVEESFHYHSQIEQDFIMTKPLKGCYLKRTHRSLPAALITAAMVLAAAFGLMSMLNAALLASVAMVATGCLTLRIAARSIDWETLLVIACAIGLGAAATESGLASHIASMVVRAGGNSPWITLAAVFAGTSIMTNVITNNAAAAFMFPIALSAAQGLDVNAMPFVIVIMISASCAFISPAGYQTNLMVWEPGNYHFTDFVRMGLPLTLVIGVLTIFLVPLVFHF